MNPVRILPDKVTLLLARVQGLRLYRPFARRLRPAFTINQVSEAEASRALASLYHVAEPPLEHQPGVYPFVAYRGTHPVGYVELIRCPQANGQAAQYWLYSLYVRSPFRGLGLGKELTGAVIRAACAEGAPALYLSVHIHNRTAQNLYRQLGFQDVVAADELRHLGVTLEPGSPQLVMRKTLP